MYNKLMKMYLVKSQRGINNCLPQSCNKRHRRAANHLSAINTVGTKIKMIRSLLFIAIAVQIPICAYSQNNYRYDSTKFFTLDQCIRYALQYQPGLNQSLVNTAIAKATNAINLSGWFPQLNLSGNMVHYSQLPKTVSPNPVTGGAPIVTPTGVANTAIPQLSASQ